MKKNTENTNIPLFQGHNIFLPAVQSRGFVQPRSKGHKFSTSRHSNMIPSESPHCSFHYRDGSAGTQCIRCVLRTRLHAAISLVLLISLSKVTLSLKRKVYKVKKKKKTHAFQPLSFESVPKASTMTFFELHVHMLIVHKK